MYRCPFKIRGYSVINNKTIPGSIGAHLREHRSSTGRQYHVRYVHKGHSIVYQHGPRDTTQQTKEQMATLTHGTQDVGGFGKKTRPRYTQPTILDAFLKLRKDSHKTKGSHGPSEDTRRSQPKAVNNASEVSSGGRP